MFPGWSSASNEWVWTSNQISAGPIKLLFMEVGYNIINLNAEYEAYLYILVQSLLSLLLKHFNVVYRY